MNTPRFSILSSILVLLTGILSVGPSASKAATLTWVTGSGSTDWSNTTHWSGATVSNGDAVIFGNGGRQSTTTVNNLVNSAYLPPNGLTLSSLTYNLTDTTTDPRWQNTGIDSGVTLTTAALNVGAVGTSVAPTVTRVTISGAGSLNVTNSGGNIQVGEAYNSSSLDMSGLANFSASMSGASTFRIGSTDNNPAASTSSVILAQTSSVTAGTLSIGSDAGAGSGAANSLKLGTVANTLNVGTINIGAGPSGATSLRGSGEVSFQSGTGSVIVRAANGTSGATMNLLNTSSTTGNPITAIANFAGHQADIKLSTLTLSRRSNAAIGNTGAKTTDSTFSFDTGTLDVATVNMAEFADQTTGNTGYSVSATLNLGSTGSTGTSSIGSLNMSTNSDNVATNITTATLNVAGGSHTVTGNITMSTAALAGGVANSSINITGGTLKVEGNIAEGTGSGTKNSTVTLNGGTLDLDNGTINVDTFNAQSGTLSNVTSINGSAGLTKTTGGTLTVTGANGWSGSTVVSAGTLVVNGTVASSSSVSVASGATLKGSGTLAAGVLGGAGTVAPGNSPGILTATQVDGTSGLDFTFEITQAGSPTYSSATASGNDVLHLTSGTPFTASLTSANVITVDFSGISLQAGQFYRGGFYASNNFLSSIQDATFQYVGASGMTFNVTTFQETANFASGTVTGGWVTQFEVLAIPEPSTPLLLGGGLMMVLLLRRRRQFRR